jgi:hypothetical protein
MTTIKGESEIRFNYDNKTGICRFEIDNGSIACICSLMAILFEEINRYNAMKPRYASSED